MGRETRRLADKIAGLSREQSDIKDNISPEAVDAALNLFARLPVRVRGHITLTKKFFPEDSFVIDHPVYGEIDSSVLKIDGGYAAGEDEEFVSKSF